MNPKVVQKNTVSITLYLQRDGNLAMYSKNRDVIWQLGFDDYRSGTKVTVEDIGNLVYQELATNTIIWQTNTKCKSECNISTQSLIQDFT